MADREKAAKYVANALRDILSRVPKGEKFRPHRQIKLGKLHAVIGYKEPDDPAIATWQLVIATLKTVSSKRAAEKLLRKAESAVSLGDTLAAL